MNYYISDLHIGHENILRFDNRPFADANEMNNKLIHSRLVSMRNQAAFSIERVIHKNISKEVRERGAGIAYTLSLIFGKYKMVILYCLMEFETVRFNELKRYLKTISDKTLSTNLKELEADKLIVRTEYPQIPPKVEYELSERGESLMEVLDRLCVWGEENRLEKDISRERTE